MRICELCCEEGQAIAQHRQVALLRSEALPVLGLTIKGTSLVGDSSAGTLSEFLQYDRQR